MLLVLLRNIIRRVERNENLRNKAILVSGLVEWMFQHHNGSMVSFDIHTNLQLEEAFERKQNVKIKIKSEVFNADPVLKRAISNNGKKQMELMRKDLKSDYQLLKKQMEVKNKHTNNEKLLYHGTAATSIDLINSKGFNRSYAGAHGATFGNGSYFAVNPAYSAGGYAQPDSQGHKRMYQARVLVGDITQGRSGMIAPPAKPGSTADLYDSVTDKQNNPSMYIIFNDIQAYPEYLLTFT
uniref:Poly [ADP-ribose] polymerase n=1 Tax=Fundulus heteroclitus TaxID=8078 RepID=A0A3Q2PCP0_FUNHE